MKGIPNYVKNGSMLLVSITHDHTLKSRMMGNYHVRFGSGGGEGDFFANHNHHELSQTCDELTGKRRSGPARTPAMAAGLTEHVWSVWEVMSYKIAPPVWVEPKRRGRPRTRPMPDPALPKRPRGRPRIRPLPDPTVPKRPRGRPRKIA
jgi:hypothetical protein